MINNDLAFCGDFIVDPILIRYSRPISRFYRAPFDLNDTRKNVSNYCYVDSDEFFSKEKCGRSFFHITSSAYYKRGSLRQLYCQCRPPHQ